MGTETNVSLVLLTCGTLVSRKPLTVTQVASQHLTSEDGVVRITISEEVCPVVDVNGTEVTVVQPGEGDTVALPGFGAVIKLTSRTNGGEVAIVDHPRLNTPTH